MIVNVEFVVDEVKVDRRKRRLNSIFSGCCYCRFFLPWQAFEQTFAP